MKLKVTVDIGELPQTGDDWELYTASMPCERAAKALTAALKKALRAVGGGASVPDALRAHFDPVARKYASHGAQDSESMYRAQRILDRLERMTKPPKAW